jgi:hypothetical protein
VVWAGSGRRKKNPPSACESQSSARSSRGLREEGRPPSETRGSEAKKSEKVPKQPAKESFLEGEKVARLLTSKGRRRLGGRKQSLTER